MSEKLFCSWSGGKDSCLAFHRAQKDGRKISGLVAMLTEGGEHSRSHGLAKSLLIKQAQAVGVPVRFGAATWDDYEKEFVKIMNELAEEGFTNGIFGDIDLEDHRKWEEMVCEKAGMKAVLPLWQEDREKILREFLDEGFKAVIVTVNENNMDESWLGRTLDVSIISELEKIGVDVCGENGEFHTFVYDGPVFKNKVDFKLGKIIKSPGYAFQEIL
jgi:uncharacterized protein (TIGR00290 family)